MITMYGNNTQKPPHLFRDSEYSFGYFIGFLIGLKLFLNPPGGLLSKGGGGTNRLDWWGGYKDGFADSDTIQILPHDVKTLTADRQYSLYDFSSMSDFPLKEHFLFAKVLCVASWSNVMYNPYTWELSMVSPELPLTLLPYDPYDRTPWGDTPYDKRWGTVTPTGNTVTPTGNTVTWTYSTSDTSNEAIIQPPWNL